MGGMDIFWNYTMQRKTFMIECDRMTVNYVIYMQILAVTFNK